MFRRVAAAVVALILAAVGVVLVLNYANRADERALEGLETEGVLVAVEAIPEGTAVDDLGEMVQTQQIPLAFIADGAVRALDELDGRLSTAAIAPGEQLQQQRFSTPAQMRARGQVELPEEAADLHQVTVALDKPRALGGNVTGGDTVGVFMSFEVSETEGYVLESDGSVVRAPAGDEGEGADTGQMSTTHLALHKVLVVRVEGGYVAPLEGASADDEGQGARDTVNVTLALEAKDAEQLVYAMEFGRVWLSLEPETADEDGTGVVVVTVPDEARNVYQ